MAKVDSWETVSSEQVADCRVFQVRRDRCSRTSDGKESDFFIIDSPDWVNVVAITSGGEFVMIEQFRHGTCETGLELPGGLIDEGESPEEAAKRELLEETGYSSADWIAIGSCSPNPAIQTNTMYYFLARDCEKTAEIELDANESIVTKLVDKKQIPRLIADGSIIHGLAVAGILYYRIHSEPAAD